VFLPGGTLGATAGPGVFTGTARPPRPFGHVPVVLVLEPDAALSASLSGSGPDAEPLGRAAAASLSSEISSGAWGRVTGIHLDFPFDPTSAAAYAALISRLKAGLPEGTFVSFSIRALPASPEDRKKIQPVLGAADALVAFVFGNGPRVDTIATDALD